MKTLLKALKSVSLAIVFAIGFIAYVVAFPAIVIYKKLKEVFKNVTR